VPSLGLPATSVEEIGLKINTFIIIIIMKNNRGGKDRTKKKGGHSNSSRPREREPKVQYYDEKTGQTYVNIGGNNNGNVVIQSGSNNSEHNHRATLEMVGTVSLLEAEHSLICTYVNNTLWKKKKFLAPSQGELD
jgi:hypothetical protein